MTRNGIAAGHALQQGIFIAFDESTSLIAEVRVVDQSPGKSQAVTQTKFNNWFQQGGCGTQAKNVRLENGQQTLTFVVQQAATGAALPYAATFQP